LGLQITGLFPQRHSVRRGELLQCEEYFNLTKLIFKKKGRFDNFARVDANKVDKFSTFGINEIATLEPRKLAESQ